MTKDKKKQRQQENTKKSWDGFHLGFGAFFGALWALIVTCVLITVAGFGLTMLMVILGTLAA